MVNRINQLLEVPSTDPEDARRRKLLNIILLGVDVVIIFVVAATLLASEFNMVGGSEESDLIYIISGGIFVGSLILYGVNRYFSGWSASMAFLIMFTLAMPFTDLPKEVAAGRSLFIFTIPIVMASVLLRPSSTFIFALLSSVEISLISFTIHEVPNVPAIAGFFMIAFVTWLSARSLENALKELTLVNQELDQRVIDRTKDLAESLTRERAEAGRNQAILQGIADGVIVFDNSMRPILVNPAFSDLVDRPTSSIIGGNTKEWLVSSGLEQHDREAVLELLQDPSSADGNLKVQWGQKTLAINAAPVVIAGEGQIGQVVVLHDFTREAEVDRMKSDFVAMVSHELRTPLSSILGYADMLREGIYGKLEDRQMGIVERVMANTNKLLSIVNDLLDQAQIEAGRLTFRHRLFRPTELTDYVSGVMEGIVRAKNLKLIMNVSDDLPPWLYGDPQRLNQVLVNLVNNAVKFTDIGHVQVSLFRRDATHWTMEVSDSGTGIPPELLKAIFEPFRQVHSDVTHRPGGIGLGLSIVKRLVNLMQGDIFVNSEMGHGSTFTVILPLSDANKEEQENE